MGMGLAGGGGARRRRGARRGAGFADINMTPFIDVVLVLLIVFMVAAPMMATGVPLDLPQSAAGPLNVEQKPLTVSVDDQGRIFIDNVQLGDDALVPALREAAKAGPDERIYLRGSKKVDYGRVAQVMGLITAGGFRKVALVTEPDQKN
ncbi:ExbD/TolR family protein [Camelimonas abortus]|uniref:ExbD/TolR family protein n=1 Tax=Camelimonas abortus TaxID=1017184 RepID=A0ABV7LDK2_9HYPH